MRGRPEDYDYELPRELIAQYPSPRRSDARLLVVRRSDGTIEHRHFFDIGEYLDPGDVLVINETKVIAARLVGRRLPTGGTVEVLLVVESRPGVWDALVRPGRKMAVGTRVVFGDASASAPSGKSVVAEVVERLPSGLRRLRFETTVPLLTLLDEIGAVPLPPYIRRPPEEDDRQRYQTVYARVPGAVAAPTAGLHFTRGLLQQLQEIGVQSAFVTLHIGLDTFRPVSEEHIEDHRMHTEYCSLRPEVSSTRYEIGRAHV